MPIRIVLIAACLVLTCITSVPGLSIFGFSRSSVFAAEQEPKPQLRLQYRSQNQTLLYVAGPGQAEADKAKTICDEQNLPFKSIATLESLPLDCSSEHAIIIGSNAIDFLGWHKDKTRTAEVFQTLESFVARGGHLFFFGSFNGRNSEQLQTFGIQTTHYHNDYFEKVPGRTEVLFKGYESTIPSPPLVHSFGNVIVAEDRESAVMLKRGKSGDPDNRKAEHDPDSPALVTVAYKRGRVSYSPIEPQSGGMWLVPIVVNWIALGAPTNANQIHEKVVVPESMLPTKNSTRGPNLTRNDLQEAQARFQALFATEVASSRTPKQHQSLAQKIVDEATASTNLVERYVFLRVACQQFAKGEQFASAAAVLSNLSNEYQFDLHHARLRLLKVAEELASNDKSDTNNVQDIVEITLAWANESAKRHQYVNATKMLSLAKSAVANAAPQKLSRLLANRLDELQPIAVSEASIKSELESSADDPKTRVGKFFALTCGDWQKGLPLISDGADPSFQSLAKKDLASPENSETQLELAEAWQATSENLTGTEAIGAKKRARHWYLAALPRRPGSEREQIESQISTLDLPKTSLTIELELEGAARMEITAEGIRWIHHYGSVPSDVKLNDVPWIPADVPYYQNSGVTRFMPVETSLQMPQLEKTKGRGLVTLERNEDGQVIVNLNDVSAGSDQYQFTIVLTR
ncbi:hypothetical protein [Rhodopirellula bahusiensis]|uniref:hypothetical protein n=1 Tax=Rhodopirellula bahusiensis TaxID=2014065 RepID=UPI003297E530